MYELAGLLADPRAYLINENPQHVTFCPLQAPESPSEVELDIILLAFHADPHKDPSLGIKVHPELVC